MNQRPGKQLRTLIPLPSILHIPSNAFEKAIIKLTNYSAQEYASSPNPTDDQIRGWNRTFLPPSLSSPSVFFYLGKVGGVVFVLSKNHCQISFKNFSENTYYQILRTTALNLGKFLLLTEENQSALCIQKAGSKNSQQLQRGMRGIQAQIRPTFGKLKIQHCAGSSYW